MSGGNREKLTENPPEAIGGRGSQEQTAGPEEKDPQRGQGPPHVAGAPNPRGRVFRGFRLLMPSLGRFQGLRTANL